jgi:metal-dependent amidase/aminoacylase/carboxypeptidase family protein
MRFSEDFGEFGRACKSALFFLGAGETHPALHNPDYDFPDALIASGAAVLHETAIRLLGRN